MRRHAKASTAGSTSGQAGRRPKLVLAAAAALAISLILGVALASATAPTTAAAPQPQGCPNADFRLGASANLPDCRAYEMVSPADKNGGEVMGEPTRTRAASDGSAVGFVSFSGFAGALGSGLFVDYMSVRGAERWATHPITPAQEPGFTDTLGLVGYEGEFSDDLSSGVFRALTPLTNAPNVADSRNLYLRDDLRTPGAGSYRLLTDSVTLQPPTPSLLEGWPTSADASEDFQQVIFESELNLTADAGGALPKVYEWDHGTLRLAGVLPDSECGSPPCPAASSSAGRGARGPGFNYTSGTMSDDGSRVFFASPVSDGGDPASDAQLYMRVNHTSTVRVNASEKDVPEPTPSRAVFDAATPSGSRVFFESEEQLTNAPDVPGSGLYVYDATKPDSAPDNLTLIAGGVQGVIGIGEDGGDAYFVSTSQLVAEAPADLAGKIYLWHEGTIHYVGTFDDPQDTIRNLTTTVYPLFSFIKGSRVSPDGSRLVFSSRSGAGLTGYDHGSTCGVSAPRPCTEVYLYDALANGGAGELSCVSCRPDGEPASSDALINPQTGNGVASPSQHLNRALSEDGRRIFFSSGERLVPEDQNGKVADVYEYDVDSAELHLISSGESNSGSYFTDASASGNDVFFITRDRLSGWDTDGGYDLYDARVGGGQPEPQLPPPSCQGDACQPAPPNLDDPTPASTTFAGPGDAKANRAKARRCPKGKHRVKARGKSRCVKRSTKQNRADDNRRASR